MVAIVNTLMNVLCQQGTAVQCSQFISSYPDVTQQLVWLVFFPSVFLILFIAFLADGVAKSGAAKYKTLVAIALYIFIIFQGWYHYFLNLSKVWFIGVIVLGGLFVLTHKMGAAGGGGGGKGSKSMREHWLKESLFGHQVLNPRARTANVRLCKEELGLMKRQRNTLENRIAHASEKEKGEAMRFLAMIDEAIVANEERLKEGREPITFASVEQRAHFHG